MKKKDDLIRDVMTQVHGMMDSGFNTHQSLDKYFSDYDQVCMNTYWNEYYSTDPVEAEINIKEFLQSGESMLVICKDLFLAFWSWCRKMV